MTYFVLLSHSKLWHLIRISDNLRIRLLFNWLRNHCLAESYLSDSSNKSNFLFSYHTSQPTKTVPVFSHQQKERTTFLTNWPRLKQTSAVPLSASINREGTSNRKPWNIVNLLPTDPETVACTPSRPLPSHPSPPLPSRRQWRRKEQQH
ncbi:hypothetical protein NPIL_680541 [Nephila pilipes]|uniref:Uncharacterized protein n=1 Tax=Nephila pilipes TaxID=299642 RepID=A0A8X6TJD2_NEPPI|nr:hypothetical protein NPIL_680541 [Nephila pilipes]